MSYGVNAVAAVVAATALALACTPASAAATDIELSIDGGTTWYSDGAPALFTDLGSLTPGTAHSASLLVRNTSPHDAVVRVAQIVASTAEPNLVSDLTFQASAPDVLGPKVRDVERAVCIPLLDGQRVAAGGVTVIDLTVTLGESSSNGSQRAAAPVEFVVSLVEETGSALPTATCGGGASSGGNRPPVIASTGSDWMQEVGNAGVLAIALLGGGLLAVTTGRRSRRRLL